MIVETGQPLLISNLELGGMLQQLGDIGDRDSSSDSHQRSDLNTPAVALFDLFSDIRKSFKVQTAVRMNASFPYISPAVALPTIPRRRIVDAGYYDNFGMNTALTWLSQESVIRWLKEYTSGVIFVQIRSYQLGSGEVDDAADSGPAYFPLPDWLTAPIQGAFSARSSSMVFRNDAQLRIFASRFCDNFVQSVTFENRASAEEIGMSWYLRPEELERMDIELAEQRNANPSYS